MNTLSTSQNTQEISQIIDISKNLYYAVEEEKFLGRCEERISLFLDTHDIPEEISQIIISQIGSKIKKSIFPITIGFGSNVIEKYKVDFFLDSSFVNDICKITTYFIWRNNMEKYIQTPASITPRILKILSYNEVKNINNLSVEDFLSRFDSFPDKVKESLFQERTTLEKHSQRVSQAQKYLDTLGLNNFSVEKIRQDGWFTDFYENVQFPEIEQKSTVPDEEFEKFLTERKKNEPQPVFITEKTKEVEKTTKFTVASLLFAGALVAGSAYNLYSYNQSHSQESQPSAMKFNESGFHVAFQDMIYTEMRKGNEGNAIKEYVMDHIGRIAFEYGLDASLFTFNVAIIKDEVVLKLQQYGQVIHLFKVPFGKRFPQYTDYYHDQNFSEELKMYLSVVIDDYRSKTDRETLELNALGILGDKMSEYVQLHNENGKYSHFKSSISKYNSEIKIDFIFLKSDNSINYQTELIIHL